MKINELLIGEAASSEEIDAFAMKIAHQMVKHFEEELKRKGAHNCATFEVTRFSNGYPKIMAKLNGRSTLTRDTVMRALKDMIAEHLPPDNLLRLEAKFGGMGIVQGANKIYMVIKPV